MAFGDVIDVTYHALWVVYLALLFCAVVLLAWNVVRRLSKRPPVRLGRPLSEESKRTQYIVVILSGVVSFPLLWLWTKGNWVFWPVAAYFVCLTVYGFRGLRRRE